MSRAGKPGYKETAVGWIPVEWALGKLEDFVAALQAGVSVNANETETGCLDGQVGVLKTSAVLGGKFFAHQHKVVVPEDVDRVASPVLADRVVISRMNTPALVGESGYVLAAQPHLFLPDRLWQTVPSDRPHSQRWLSYWLQLPAIKSLIAAGATGTSNSMKNISKDVLLTLPTPHAPFPEQQKIAAILTAVDDKLDLIARQISATQALKQGLMQTLFTRGAGTPDAQGRWHPHTAFQDTELGRIPVGWRVGHLQDYIAALRSGVSVNAEDRIHGDGEVGVLKVSCVLHGKFYPQGHKTVPPEEVARVAEPVLQGRIIISRANTPALVGESAYVDRAWPDLFLPDKLWQTEASDLPHSVKWLAFYLQSPFVRQEISKAATGTSGSMKNIAKPALLNIAMPLVPVAEQEYVAELLSSVVDKLTTLTTQRTHYQSLKRGLMQKLLTGQWRVRVDAAALAPVNEEAPA